MILMTMMMVMMMMMTIMPITMTMMMPMMATVVIFFFFPRRRVIHDALERRIDVRRRPWGTPFGLLNSPMAMPFASRKWYNGVNKCSQISYGLEHLVLS